MIYVLFSKMTFLLDIPLPMNTLEIRNSSQKGINVPDANLLPVSSTSDVIYLMNVGQRNRAVGSTALNDRSSRSHRYISCLMPYILALLFLFQFQISNLWTDMLTFHRTFTC